MPSGLYIAASGMNATVMREDVIANNMANLSTVGFKQNRSVDIAFPTYLIARLHDQRMKVLDGTTELRPNIGIMGGGVIPQEVTTDYSQGTRIHTNNPLDLSLTGPDYFFSVLGPDGKTFLTRSGNFNMDGNGRLVTQDGLPVLGHNGEVFIDGSTVAIDEEGSITVDDKPLDQLLIVRADVRQLTKVGRSMFEAKPPAKIDMSPDDIQVQQGFLEQSNVNAIQEMIHMIEVHRSYELNAKMVLLYDRILGEAATFGDVTNLAVY
jgi:flagellar basal-body rod protein FlgF